MCRRSLAALELTASATLQSFIRAGGCAAADRYLGTADTAGAAAASSPVLDVFGAQDWDVISVGASERLAQIARIPGSQQVVVADAQHFFEGKHDELTRVIVAFLDRAHHR